MYQSTIVVGHLGRDPEMRYTASGTPVTNFTMATTRRWKTANGEDREKTTWFRVAAWGTLAETCNQYLTKGQLALVEGEIDASAWVGNDGEARASLELRARTVKFLGRRETTEVSAPPEEDAGEEGEDLPF